MRKISNRPQTPLSLPSVTSYGKGGSADGSRPYGGGGGVEAKPYTGGAKVEAKPFSEELGGVVNL